MAPKKKSRSALFYFIQEKKDKGLVRGSFQECMDAVHEEWKAMGKSEREPYERMFKDYKQSLREERIEITPASFRQEYHSETTSLNSRSSEIQNDLNSFFSKISKSKESVSAIDLVKKQKWYIVKFQTFCKCEENPTNYRFGSRYYYVLAEVGAIEYSLQDGITNQFHAFIKPNEIPLGYRSLCMESSRDVHQIPIEKFDQIRLSNSEIYSQLEKFLRPKSENNYFVPVFCLGKDVDETKFGLEFLEFDSGLSDTRCLSNKVYDLECLVMHLSKVCNYPISYNSARDLLTAYTYDYSSDTRCHYHDELGVINCAIGITKKLAYLISDELCPSFGVEVTERHLPTEKPVGTVIYNDEFKVKSSKQSNREYGKRAYDNDGESISEGYTTIRTAARSNMISVDIRYQNQQIPPSMNKSGSNRRLVALETAFSDVDSVSDVSTRMNQENDDDNEGWTVIEKKNKSNKNDDDDQSIVSTKSSATSSLANSESTFKTIPTTRFMGRGRGIVRN